MSDTFMRMVVGSVQPDWLKNSVPEPFRQTPQAPLTPVNTETANPPSPIPPAVVPS